MSEESGHSPPSLDAAAQEYERGLAKFHGLDPDEIVVKDDWQEAMEEFWDDPVGSYQEAIERHEQMIEEYKRRIKNHKKAIAHLEGQMQAAEIEEKADIEV